MKKLLAIVFAFPAALFAAGDMLYDPGTYRCSARGKRGSLVLDVVFSQTKIEKISVVKQSETAFYAEKALILVPRRIIRAQSADVDAVSGSSVTSGAVSRAVQKCINKAAAARGP